MMTDSADRLPLTCDDVEQQHAAYIWGALAPEETVRIEAHRRGCPDCHDRLLVSERLIARLDEAAPRHAPPPELRTRVLATVEELAASVPGAPVRRAEAAPVRRNDLGAPHAGGWAPGQRGRTARERGFFTGLATGVCGTLAAAALALVLVIRPDALGLISGRASQFGPEPEPASPRPVLLPAPEARSGTRLIELTGAASAGRGSLAYDPETHDGVLMLQGVDAPVGSEYAVWLVKGSQRLELGRFAIQSGGFGVFVLPRPLPVDQPDRIELGPLSPASGASDRLLSASF